MSLVKSCRIRNKTNSRRILHNARGRPVALAPGEESKEMEFLVATLKSNRRWGVIEVIETDTPPVKEPEDPELAALQAEATALGIELDGRWKAPRLKKEIAKAKKATA